MRSKIAWKPVGDINTASARLRAFLPCKYLQEAGIDCELFRKENTGHYKVVIFQKSYSDEDIELATTLKKEGAVIVFDLCDNHFYIPSPQPHLQERAARLQRMIEVANKITVSTPELGKLLHGKPFTVIDDFLEQPKFNFAISLYHQIKRSISKSISNTFRIVWFGIAGSESPHFGMVDIVKVLPILEKMNKTIPVELTVISNSKELFDRYTENITFKKKYFPWNSKTFPYLFIQHEVCIIPISINPFTICKTHNRLVLSLLLGVPVIVDKIPSYEEFSRFILHTDWEKALFAYATNKTLRDKHINEGKSYVKKKYTPESIIQQWYKFLTVECDCN